MSAYIVEDKLINKVIAFLAMSREHDYLRRMILTDTGADVMTSDGREALGNAMFALNCNSIEQRYGKGQAADFRELDYAYRSELPANMIQTYKSLNSFLYQCCEGDIPDSNLLYSTLQRVSDDLAHSIVRTMPAYDKAAW